MTTTLSIRVDSDLKADVEELFSDIGMNITTAVTTFFKKAIDVGGIPFSIRRRKLTPYEETLAAAEEAKRIARDPNAPSCTDLSKLKEFMLS